MATQKGLGWWWSLHSETSLLVAMSGAEKERIPGVRSSSDCWIEFDWIIEQQERVDPVFICPEFVRILQTVDPEKSGFTGLYLRADKSRPRTRTAPLPRSGDSTLCGGR